MVYVSSREDGRRLQVLSPTIVSNYCLQVLSPKQKLFSMPRVSKWESVRVRESEKMREWLLSIDMKTKVLQHVESDWMREWERVRVRECSGSQLLSDIQTFFSWEPALWMLLSRGMGNEGETAEVEKNIAIFIYKQLLTEILTNICVK